MTVHLINLNIHYYRRNYYSWRSLWWNDIVQLSASKGFGPRQSRLICGFLWAWDRGFCQCSRDRIIPESPCRVCHGRTENCLGCVSLNTVQEVGESLRRVEIIWRCWMYVISVGFFIAWYPIYYLCNCCNVDCVRPHIQTCIWIEEARCISRY